MQSGNELQTAPSITISELIHEIKNVMYVNVGLNRSSIKQIRKALTSDGYRNNPFVTIISTKTTVIDGKEVYWEDLSEEERKGLEFRESKKVINPPSELELVGQIIRYAIEGHDETITLSKKESLSINIVGPHGYGKTEGIEHITKLMGIKFKSVEPAQWTEMGEITGFPLLKENESGEVVTKYAKAEMIFPTEAGPGILLLDDFNRTNSGILNGLMQVIQKQKLMGNFFPAGWTIMLSSNPDNDQYDVTSMDAAQLTRMSTFKLTFEHKSWVEYMLEQDINHNLLRFFIDHKNLFFIPQSGKNSQSGNGNTLTVPRSVANFLKLQRLAEEFVTEDGNVSEDISLIRSSIVRSAKSIMNDDVANMLNSWISNQRKPMITADDILEGFAVVKDSKGKIKSLAPAYAEKLNALGEKLTKFFKSVDSQGKEIEDIPYKSVFYAGIHRCIINNRDSITNETMGVLIRAYSSTPFIASDAKAKDNQDRERASILMSLINKDETLHHIRNFPTVKTFFTANLSLTGSNG